MEENKIIINQVDPTTFEFQQYTKQDNILISSSRLDTAFTSSTDYIEYYAYDESNNLIYPLPPSKAIPVTNYSVINGDTELYPSENLEELGYDEGSFYATYNFYRKILSSDINTNYYISEISSDRTEVRLNSNTIPTELIISSSIEFIEFRKTQDYFVDFLLNFGNDQQVIANNLKLDTTTSVEPSLLVKLYEPLPSQFDLKSTLWVVKEISASQAYNVIFPPLDIIPDDIQFIKGPNYSIRATQETGESSQTFTYNTLVNTNITSSANQLQNILNRKEIAISIDYTDYNNFIHFSSAYTRLENFYYKVGLIQSSSNAIDNLPLNSGTYSASKAEISNNINRIISNLDGWEYFMYFNSGSEKSYPKQNTEPPYILFPTDSTEALTWVGSVDETSGYYGGQALNASNYDSENPNYLYNAIPEYLREDPENGKYELFVDMVAQQYDNTWLYTKNLTTRFDADNRLDFGISKDLVADAIRDFGIKLYSNNFNSSDLYTAFLGITPSGSTFPFPYMTGSIDGQVNTPTGYEYVDTQISASDDIVPLDNINKSLYKRIYHNLPYLLKTKGTIAGIRALITSYGIPDTILRINEFGGKDRNESQDYDLKQDVFNYAFDTGVNATNYLSSSLEANSKFPVQNGTNKARTIQLRFKPSEIPLPINNIANSNIRYSQSIFSTDNDGGNLVLEYTGDGLVSGSHSGSIPDPYDTYGTLKWIPAEGDNPDLSASVYLPFFNGDWWSVQMNVNGSIPTASLYAANEVNGKVGFNESDSVGGFNDLFYYDATEGYLNKDVNVVFNDGTIYTPFSGSFQELRYYVQEISQSYFQDYVVNPYSSEGNSTHPTDIVGSSTIFSNDLPNQQFFRADLGTQLNTSSRTSIHPRVTGSDVQITQSFNDKTNDFYINTPNFITNVEDIFQDQIPAGIKNRITDKVQTEKVILAEAPYGFKTPTSTIATISSVNNDTQTISPMESIQQTSFISQSVTPNINYLEVAFSPSNQINDDINAQLGYFNLGEFIGDPRFVSSSLYTYPDLDRLRNSYFEKYMDSYNVVDFVRLIKFFDNSLFKMIKDFTPARTSLSSGVVVKQHILERNRQRPAQATSSLHDYEGLVVNLPKDYSSGSTDFPQYSTEGSAIYKFSGGTGGSFERFNGEQTYGIPKFGTLLGRDGIVFGSGTNLRLKIISNTLIKDDGNEFNSGNLSDIPAIITKADGFYPIDKQSDFILTNIGVDCRFANSKPLTLSVFATTSNNIPLSAGNQVTIVGSSLDPNLTGKIVAELIDSQITPSSNWNATVPYNRFGVTQSWQDGNDGSVLNPNNFNQSSSQFISGSYLGPRKFRKDNQSEFYDGIFSGSMIIVATQSLNPGCDPYLNANDTPIIYNPLFFPLQTSTNQNVDAVVDTLSFINQRNVPRSGQAWISSTVTNQGQNGVQQVQSIKLSQIDATGAEVINYLDDFDNLRVLFPDANLPYNAGATEYIITGRTIYADHAILQVSPTEGNNFYQVIDDGISTTTYYPITSSINGGSDQWSLTAATDYIRPLENSESADTRQQNVFLNSTVPSQEQNIFFYNNFNPNTEDALGFFDPGSNSFDTNRIFAQNRYWFGAYTIDYTPNIPWYIEASFKYSASLNLNVSGVTEQKGIYHKGISYTGVNTLVNQNFSLTNNGVHGFYVKSNLNGQSSAASAVASPNPNSSDPIVYYEWPGNEFPQFVLNDPNGFPTFYSDPELTIPAVFGDGTNKWFKFSNLETTGAEGQHYFIVFVSDINEDGLFLGTLGEDPTGSGCGFRIPTTPCNVATISYINTPFSGYFRPAPVSVSNLGEALFNGENWNTQLPGNSGSGVDMNIYAGHPKVKVPLTSEIYWDFSELELKGTPPTLAGGGSTSFVPFSGSDALDGNLNFGAVFSFFVGGYTPEFLEYTGGVPGLNPPDMGPSFDGSILIQWLDTTPNSVFRKINDSSPSNPSVGTATSADFKLNAEIDAGAGADFTVRFAIQRFSTLNLLSDRVILMEIDSDTTTGKATFNNALGFYNGINGMSGVGAPFATRLYFEIKNNGNTDLDYTFKVDSLQMQLTYISTSGNTTTLPGLGQYMEIMRGGAGANNEFQFGNPTNVALASLSTDYYAECVVNAYLKRTGSQGDFIITSSVYDPLTGLGGYSGSIYSGSVINFSESPIVAFEDTPFNNPNNTGSTRSETGDLYYTEYEFTNFKSGIINGNAVNNQNIAFQSANNIPLMQITSSGDGGSSPDFNISNSSVILRKSNLGPPSPTNTGQSVLTMEWDTTGLTETSVGQVTVSGSYGGVFNANDIHRFSMFVNKTGYLGSGLVITEFTASIRPSQSIYSPLTEPFIPAYNNYKQPENTNFVVPTYYAGALPFELALDCQPLLNNFILQRQSEYIMDVDYTNESGPIIPVNQEQILENIAVKASVPDSNYTSLRSINPRYNGVKSTSAKINQWSVGDFGTYGKNPTVELRDAFFGYFNDLDDPYPNINGLTRVNLSYLVDEQGNALPPSLEPITIDTFNAVFPNTTVGKIAVRDINSKYQNLGAPSLISRVMEYVTPICYSQNSGENYSSKIPLTGSGFVSRYDNDDENSVTFAQFSAAGTASISNTNEVDQRIVSYFLDPSELVSQPANSDTNPYVVGTGVGDVKAGASSYPSNANIPIDTSPWDVGPGADLNNEQIISMQTSVVTTHVSETRGTRDELKMRLKMHYGNITEPATLKTYPFNLEYIDCKVYTETGQVYLIKNVDEYGWFKYQNLENNQNLGPRYNPNLDRWKTSRVRVPEEGLIMTAEWEMFETLFDLGLMRERYPKGGSGVIALEWIFSANSGRQSIKAGNELNWSFSGEFKVTSNGWKQGYFFPNSYTGAYTPTKIQGAGVSDHLLSEANIAVAPFWQFSASATEPDDYSFVEMVSTNFNEAYGTGFYQGDIPYLPGTSQYFPGNVEPKTTAFDPIENPLEFQENDEIRFGNNENFTYRVLEVFAPQENNGKVKLRLDKAVDTSINKDFFLVRRKIVNPNSLYLDTPFPYGILSSGSISQVIMNTGSNSLTLDGNIDSNGNYTGSVSDLELATTPGILFPDFPTEYLIKSASMIVNDLISKGIIES